MCRCFFVALIDVLAAALVLSEGGSRFRPISLSLENYFIRHARVNIDDSYQIIDFKLKIHGIMKSQTLH